MKLLLHARFSSMLKIVGENNLKVGDEMPLGDLFEELQKCNNNTVVPPW